MHNLDLTFFKEFNLKDVKDSKEFRIDPTDADKVYFRDKDSISVVSLSKQNVAKIVDFPCEIIGFEYLSMNNELCIGTEDGAIYVYNLSTGMQEEVTYCEDGISSLQFSWDQETLVVVTKKANVVVLNCAYDVVHEANLLDEYFGEKQFINVGWGKEETQFQGLAGKKAALKKGQDLLEAAGDTEDASTFISWREDCEYFVVSFANRDQGRMFKVFNKEGVLQFTSEKCSALQSSIAWRPSGNWIGVPEVYRNKYIISLFEKNGLKHREIVLPFVFEEEFVVNLAWSNDSEVLLIHTRQITEGKDCLYLYTIGNYHWYLKQTMRFDTKVTHITWSPRSNEKKTLYVSLDNGQLLSYQWNYVINHSLGHKDTDEGVVGVIDGNKLLLTGFRGTVVPPPMCNFQLDHGKNINFVRFVHESDSNPNQFIIVDCDNDIYRYECRFSQRTVRCLTDVEKKDSLTFKTNETVPMKRHKWLYKNEKEIIFVNNELIFYGTVNGTEIDLHKAFEMTKTNLGSLILKKGLLYAHYYNGEVTAIKENSETTVLKVGQFSSQFQMTCDEDVVLLQPWQNLYLNEQCLASNVTSYAIVDHFLMYTTLEELCFINLQASKKMVVAERKLERGSKIVLVVPGTSKTVLQLPRGNLETIHPRILSLCMIRTLLDEKSYKEAFKIMRKERINLNLLVDHNPNEFLTNIDTFIDDINNIQWLDLFLTELQNADMIGQMYPYYHQNKLVWEHFLPENKINFVCQRMIETLIKRNDSKYCLPLITCYVKKGEVGNALKLIWDLKLKGDQGVSTDGATTSDETFKYLLYLVNVNDLYNIALGLYDFALVLYVAKRSQKDPKEYVPFLEELDKLEENYRRYKIDCYIKRFEPALQNISQCGESKLEEAIALIEKHELYSIALECYKTQEECYKKVCSRYGDFLRQKHKLLEASFMYERAADFKSAISCARNALAWKRCISLAKRSDATEEELNLLVSSLISALEGAGLYSEAASIAADYVTRTQAIDLLVKGKMYDDAILLCYKKGELGHLVEQKIKPSLSEYMESLIMTIEEETELFKKQKDRLVLLRVQRANPIVDEDGRYVDDDMDLFSDTSSMNSSRYTTSSGKTSKSSKNRRKHERKLFSLKEGSKFEDIALVDALHKLVIKIFSTDQLRHIKTILTTATDLKLDDKARKLQVQYKNLMHMIKISLNDIWIPEMIVSEEISPCNTTGIINYDQIQRNQHYSLIKPHQRYKPELADVDFELEIYK